MVWVAPNSRSRGNLDSTGSTTTISPAPARRAPWTAAAPTPPAPTTRTVEPGVTWAVLMTAPTPVMTAQLTSEATSNGTPSPTNGTTLVDGSTTSSAQAPSPTMPNPGSPAIRKLCVAAPLWSL